MPRAVAYYLLLLYTTLVLNPVIPGLIDKAAHLLAPEQHQHLVHAIQGNNHAHEEMAKRTVDMSQAQHAGTDESLIWGIPAHEGSNIVMTGIPGKSCLTVHPVFAPFFIAESPGNIFSPPPEHPPVYTKG